MHFTEKYHEFLSQFDGFIVTPFSSFAFLYEKTNKPIIIVNAARYEIPFTDKPDLWKSLDRFLISGAKKNKIFFVANNIGDAKYLEFYTGIESEIIPSLCLYSQAEHSGKNREFIFHNPRNRGSIKLLERAFETLGLATQCPRDYGSFQTVCDYRGIVHIPYQISTMSIFEQYSANIPLFFPSKDFLFSLQRHNPAYFLDEVSFFHLFKAMPAPTATRDLNNLKDPNIVRFWIDSADYYDEENMPHILYFHSFEHLRKLLQTVDTQEISRKMKEHNLKKKKKVFDKWKELLDKVAQA